MWSSQLFFSVREHSVWTGQLVVEGFCFSVVMCSLSCVLIVLLFCTATEFLLFSPLLLSSLLRSSLLQLLFASSLLSTPELYVFAAALLPLSAVLQLFSAVLQLFSAVLKLFSAEIQLVSAELQLVSAELQLVSAELKLSPVGLMNQVPPRSVGRELLSSFKTFSSSAPWLS